MDPTSLNTTDDQELAKVLESMNQQAGGLPTVPTTDDSISEPIVTSDEAVTAVEPVSEPSEEVAETTIEEVPAPEPAPEATVAPVVEPVTHTSSTATSSPELDALKRDALEELRPLVDKLDLPADEKFDTLLLLIRSTDDKTLLGAAHEAAKGIADETKRAQALLDVIKEIDYFSGHGQQPQ